RERVVDLPEIAEFLMRKHGSANPRGSYLTPELLAALANHDWPGNIRELENVVRKLIVLRSPKAIISDLKGTKQRRPAAPSANTKTGEPDPLALESVLLRNEAKEAEAIVTALNAVRWNRKRAAAVLKVDYKALLYRMKKLGITAGEP